MYNKETVIRLNTLDDVQEFVGAASKCDFDIDLKYRQILIDAKSLLGVIGIGINNDFKAAIWAMTRHLIMWLINSL